VDDGPLSNITSQNCGRNKKVRRKEKDKKLKNPSFARMTIRTTPNI
jgi:hypothetical protein